MLVKINFWYIIIGQIHFDFQKHYSLISNSDVHFRFDVLINSMNINALLLKYAFGKLFRKIDIIYVKNYLCHLNRFIYFTYFFSFKLDYSSSNSYSSTGTNREKGKSFFFNETIQNSVFRGFILNESHFTRNEIIRFCIPKGTLFHSCSWIQTYSNHNERTSSVSNRKEGNKLCTFPNPYIRKSKISFTYF